jgi:hypothetical protein
MRLKSLWPVAQSRLVRLLCWAECKLAEKRAAIDAQLVAFCRASRQEWEAGTLRGSPARRHRKTGECQFVLWQAGEQGHTADHWIRFDSSWWSQFLPNVLAHPRRDGSMKIKPDACRRRMERLVRLLLCFVT